MKDLLFSFEGRIPRSHYWGGTLLLTLVAVVIIFASVILFLDEDVPFSESSLVRLNSLIGMCLLYPVSALMIKRLKDRNRPLWLVVLFLAPYALILLGETFGLTASHEVVGGVYLRTPNLVGKVLETVNLCVMVFALIELGILRGTQGDNQWGPDPLQKSGV
ncbi:MAG: DUF805 domain-containing protein [Pseudomonadota bacterium]